MFCAAIIVFVCFYVDSGHTRHLFLNARIVGGTDAEIKHYPYQLDMMHNGRHICGAAIINEKWAITAAHCSNFSLKNVNLCSGTTLVGGGTRHSISRIIMHENFNSKTAENDIALIQVNNKFIMGDEVKPIALADFPPSPSENGTITGWGRLSEEGDFAQQLQVVNVLIIDSQKCNILHGNKIKKNMICAGYVEGDKDACSGDSGGPLVVCGKLAGIVSWGIGCARRNKPGVYTNIASYREWVTEKSGIKV